MKGSIFVLGRNYARVTPRDIAHTVRNIGKVRRFVDYAFEKEHDWAIVIYNGPHTSRGLATHSTIFGFIQVGRHEFGQSWGAHIFVDGTVEYFFDAKRVLFDDEMILINLVFPDFIAHTIKFHSNNTISWVA